MNSDEYIKRKNEIIANMHETSSYLEKGACEAERVYDVMSNTKAILDDLDTEFSEKTGLTATDTAFLFLAIGLQILRQYLLTKFPVRQDDQIEAKKTKGHIEEHSDRSHRYYNPSLEEIITNPVPFDANIGANGALSGGGKMGHRVTAIGHDPLLGLVFGTANIATSTLTTNTFQSYHIYTNEDNRDFFRNQARTDLVIMKTFDKLFNQGIDGKMLVAASLMKEIIHLKSDLNTKNSLPLPVVSVVNPQLASQLASFGLDMSNIVTVGKQAVYANFINMIIAMLHGLFYDGETERERKLYEVRTRKILMYSNLVATSSNLAVVALTQDLKKLDVGGAAITIYRLIKDVTFIKKVKEEFIFGSFKDMIRGDDSWMYIS